jgi:hypothetical protein
MAKPPVGDVEEERPTDTGRDRSKPPPARAGSPLTGRGARVALIGDPSGPPDEFTDWSNAETLERQAYTDTDTPVCADAGTPAVVRNFRSNGWPGVTVADCEINRSGEAPAEAPAETGAGTVEEVTTGVVVGTGTVVGVVAGAAEATPGATATARSTADNSARPVAGRRRRTTGLRAIGC